MESYRHPISGASRNASCMQSVGKPLYGDFEEGIRLQAGVGSARHAYLDAANAREVRLCVITRSKRKLPHEGARHHDVACPDAVAKLGELARQPHDRVEWIAKDRVPSTDDNLFTIQ